jgi:hypothetical protein
VRRAANLVHKKSVIILGVTLMTALIAILALHSKVSDPFQRFKSFNAVHPTLFVSFSTLVQNRPGIKGTFLIERPSRSLFTSFEGKDKFSASNTERGYVEIDTADRVYDESPSGGGIGVRSSRISSTSGLAPNVILFTDLKRALPAGPTITVVGDADELHGTAKSQMGTTDVWATVDGQGEITRYRIKSVGPQGSSDLIWNFNYSFPSHLSLASFLTPLPLGYLPYALPPEPTPLQVGSMVPSQGWRMGGQTVELLDLAHHHPFLLAILDDQPPSEMAREILALHNLRVLVVGRGGLADPSGDRLRLLNPPGAPMFYLVGGDGKVTNIWLGFDRSQSGSFIKSLLDAMAKQTPLKGS